jgi:hypothetical protein
MKYSLDLLEEAVARVKEKQERFMIKPNDIFWQKDTMMVMEGKEFIWDLVNEEIDLIIKEERNKKLSVILDNSNKEI